MQRSTTTEGSTPRYARARRLAVMLDVNPSTLWRWVAIGRLPPPHRLGPRVSAWNLDEVEQALRTPQP